MHNHVIVLGDVLGRTRCSACCVLLYEHSLPVHQLSVKERFSSHFWVATFHALEGPYQAGFRGTAYRLRGTIPRHILPIPPTPALLHQYLIQVHALGIPQTSTWQTGVKLFKNVFFKAFLPGFETEVRGFFW